MHCPKCKSLIKEKDVNVSDDIVRCWNCDSTFRPSEALELQSDLHHPPHGCWIKRTERYVEIGASTGTTIIIFTIPFLAVFNWILLKVIFQAPYDQIEVNRSLIFTILLFVLLDLVFLYLTFLKTFGIARVRMDTEGGEVFIGFWGIGTTRKFEWKNIDSITEEEAYLGFKRERGKTILLEGSKSLSFGVRIEEANREYLINKMRQLRPKRGNGTILNT